MTDNKRVLSLQAHPDDTEFSCAGTLALLHKQGWEIFSATVAMGDCGTAEYSREEITRIRKGEATKAAQILDADYYCLEAEDIFIMYDKPTIIRAIELIRKVRPAIVFAPSPSDYMLDHEISSKLVQTACFAAGIPNIPTPPLEIYEHVPHLYYVDPFEAKDKFAAPIIPGMWVDISSVIDIKEEMLCCHASQRNWLLEHHGIDEYILGMKRFGEKRGKEINVGYAEAFRQHLGHAYPQDNILKSVLDDLLYEK